MANKLTTTDELTGVRVIGGKKGTKRIGKVRRFVFHPKEKRVVGFVVKRPDLLWMFRRKDLFVAVSGYEIEDGRIVVSNDPAATNRAACKALGVDWDACVLWVGLPVMTEDGDALGVVGSVTFDRKTGVVDSVTTDSGATANALLGKREIPANLVKGFRRGMGAALAQTGAEGEESEEVVLGAILVAEEARDIAVEGGLAEKAGEATAVVVDKAHTAVDKAKPVASAAAKKTGEVVNKGAYATGKQIAATKGMFSGFKEEYDKARGPKPSQEKALEKAAEPKAEELPAPTAQAKKAPAKQGAAKQGAAKKQAAKKPAPKKNMFSAFKEEYDKARHDD
ncbi:MAG: PRC-barrel domain-containing protein [Gordonibacter pamelaeae]|uniref:PRC-barrel domain n=2 Tax=Gordonibacter pamelaeae TaxID=471189 RepID=D6E811_9ACTN|nr:PRC-barrel domain-containing protein [Gordonibacter pamelaeae]MBS4894219.1 PRC-barrel domain-containing protein [Gordonibacter pamelaeae]MCB6310881.1 PRC-barrel domain-containing protein [Gordonibacter pamelaeae]MCQ4846004.1 PRC-barrel domain-containing protein [Gordonibacter pamelaeae]MCQ4848797.1 PRC-barrel domain-containing protein [Gordonibacter pamelaeae]MSA60603.1 PRC-barrel domain protein [Gordonibacter pamelaeae]